MGNNCVWAAESAWGMAGSPLSHAGFVWLRWEAECRARYGQSLSSGVAARDPLVGSSGLPRWCSHRPWRLRLAGLWNCHVARPSLDRRLASARKGFLGRWALQDCCWSLIASCHIGWVGDLGASSCGCTCGGDAFSARGGVWCWWRHQCDHWIFLRDRLRQRGLQQATEGRLLEVRAKD